MPSLHHVAVTILAVSMLSVIAMLIAEGKIQIRARFLSSDASSAIKRMLTSSNFNPVSVANVLGNSSIGRLESYRRFNSSLDAQQKHRSSVITPVSIGSSLLESSNTVRPESTVRFKRIPLITGCGRSGTLSLVTYLNSIGIKAVHESARPGSVSVSWLYGATLARSKQGLPLEPWKSFEYRRKLVSLIYLFTN